MATVRPPFQPPGPDAPVFVISVAAELSGLHPQTLRTYERLGLISPGRTGGGGRRYSARDIELLREIADLTASGIGIEGVRRILDLENRVAALSQRNEELQAELEGAQAALRQAVARRTAPLGPTTATATATGGAVAAAGRQPNKLPVLRRPEPGQAIVVWRRQRG